MKFKMKIESGIQIPQISRNGVTQQTAELMKQGDSVFLPSISRVNYLKKNLKLLNKKPVVRAVDGGWRVWVA